MKPGAATISAKRQMKSQRARVEYTDNRHKEEGGREHNEGGENVAGDKRQQASINTDPQTLCTTKGGKTMRNLRQPVASGCSTSWSWGGFGRTRRATSGNNRKCARRRKSNFTASFLKTNKSVGSKGAFRHRMAWHNRNEL